MGRRLLRALFTTATVLVAWLVVTPASALTNASPLCDPRGAITFAPPPQLQDEERSIDIPADCFDESPLYSKQVLPGRGPVIDISFSQEPASVTASVIPAVPLVGRLPARTILAFRPPSGVRASLERPPRS